MRLLIVEDDRDAAEYLVKGGPAREIVDAIKRYGPVPGTA